MKRFILLLVITFSCILLHMNAYAIDSKEYKLLYDFYSQEDNNILFTGNEEKLYVSNKENNSVGYMIFEIPELTNDSQSAILSFSGETSHAKPISVYLISDNDALELKNINSGKIVLKEKLGSCEPDENMRYEIDVTSYLNTRSIRNKIGFALKLEQEEICDTYIYSSESNYSPKLTIIENIKTENNINEEKDTPVDNNAPMCEPPVIPEAIDSKNVDIDKYTTTYTRPWMINYHLTTLNQLDDDYYGGECGQKIFSMAISPSNSNHIYVGHDTEMLWKSEDGGVTWFSSSNGLMEQGTLDVIFDPDNENIAYVASEKNHTGDAKAPKSKYTGVYKTTDGGKNWRLVLNINFIRFSGSEVFCYGEPDKNGQRALYVASNYDGVYKSIDGGESWNCIGLKNTEIVHLNISNGTLICSTLDKGILVSIDDGLSWEEKNNGIKTKRVLFTAINPKNSAHWFCIEDEQMYESYNNGDEWVKLVNYKEAGVNSVGFSRIKFSPIRKDGSVRMYLCVANNQYMVRYSEDLGHTWNKPVHHTENAFMQDNWGWSSEPMEIDKNNPDILFACMDGEIFKSTDAGKSFFPSSSGVSGWRAAAFAFDPDDPYEMYIGAVDRGMVKTVNTNNNETYRAVNYMPFEDRHNIRYGVAKNVKAIAIDPKNHNRVLICIGYWGKEGCIKESVDGGLNWKIHEQTENDSSTNLIHFHNKNSDIIYAGKYVSFDDGENWTDVVYTISAVSPFNNDIVYAIDNNYILKSVDCGKTWKTLGCGQLGSIQRITHDLFKENKLYVGLFSRGFKIVEGENGETVTSIGSSNGITENDAGMNSIYSIDQDPNDENHLVAGGTDNANFVKTNGLYESFDSGKTWSVVEGIDATCDIWFVKFHPTLKRVYISTSSGVWVYEFDKKQPNEQWNYTDINDSYAKTEIESLKDKFISIYGSNGNFYPDKNMTRGDFIKLISKSLNIDSKNDVCNRFIDIDAKSRYYVYANSLYDAGIIYGTLDMKLLPNECITYNELFNIVARILSYYNYKVVPYETQKDSISLLKHYKIIKDNDKFINNLEQYASREDIAYMLNNLFDLLNL